MVRDERAEWQRTVVVTETGRNRRWPRSVNHLTPPLRIVRYVRYRTDRHSSTDYAFRVQRTTVEVAMNQTPDELWLSFKALAKTYPHDDGVRITAHLARWLIQERQRLQIPIPAVLQKVVEEVVSPVSPLGRQSPVTSV